MTLIERDDRRWTILRSDATSQHAEYLDMGAAVKRLHEAMREMPDASLRDWLDVALNGWPDA